MTVHRRRCAPSLNAARRGLRIRRLVAATLRRAGTLCVAGLSLSNAPPQDPADAGVRIALAEVRTAATPAAMPAGAELVRCRSHLDGSFAALVDAAAGTFANGNVRHIVTDVTALEGSSARVAMIFEAHNARGLRIVREARATIDLASCAATDLSVPPA